MDDFTDDTDDTDRDDDEPRFRDRCLFPGSCIVADPYHDPEQCWTPEHVEAYEAELGAADAACCDVGEDCTVHGCEEMAVAFFRGDLDAGDA